MADLLLLLLPAHTLFIQILKHHLDKYYSFLILAESSEEKNTNFFHLGVVIESSFSIYA